MQSGGAIEMVIEKDQIKRGASIPELADDYGISESLLYRLANANKLPGCRRLGYRFVCHRGEFEEWLRTGGKE